MQFVLDCSVSIAWFLDDEKAPNTDAILDLFAQGHTAIVPALWCSEFLNALRNAANRNRLEKAKLREIIKQVAALPIRVSAEPPQLAHLFSCYQKHSLTPYDAAYLELAMRLRLPIACVDEALMQAAVSAGIEVI